MPSEMAVRIQEAFDLVVRFRDTNYHRASLAYLAEQVAQAGKPRRNQL